MQLQICLGCETNSANIKNREEIHLSLVVTFRRKLLHFGSSRLLLIKSPSPYTVIGARVPSPIGANKLYLTAYFLTTLFGKICRLVY